MVYPVENILKDKDKVKALEDEVTRLKSALNRYGQHDNTCFKVCYNMQPRVDQCTCGLEDSIRNNL